SKPVGTRPIRGASGSAASQREACHSAGRVRRSVRWNRFLELGRPALRRLRKPPILTDDLPGPAATVVKIAPLPANEQERLASLERYNVLDTPPEPAFDDLTRLTAQLCAAPVSLIALLDSSRVWFKSRFGLAAAEAPRDYSFCSHTILQRELLVVE